MMSYFFIFFLYKIYPYSKGKRDGIGLLWLLWLHRLYWLLRQVVRLFGCSNRYHCRLVAPVTAFLLLLRYNVIFVLHFTPFFGYIVFVVNCDGVTQFWLKFN